jgi:mono/diheme cytochrome c family protein
MRTPPPLDTPREARALERYYMVGLACMAVLIGAFPLYRATEPARRAEAAEATHRENVELGKEQFALHCASCHGDGGRGGRGMPTLAAKEFLGAVSDRQLHWLIAGGIPGTAMSAYDLDLGGPFTAQEIDRLVTYLRALEDSAESVPGWREGAAAPVRAVIASAEETASPSTPDGTVATGAAPEASVAPGASDSAAAGSPSAAGDEQAAAADDQELPPALVQLATRTYAATCAACHGPAGEGTPIAPALRPLRAPLDRNVDSLIVAIAAGKPGTAMMAFGKANGGTLDDATIRAVARWLQRSASQR